LNRVTNVTNMHNDAIRILVRKAARCRNRMRKSHPVAFLENRVFASMLELRASEKVRLCVRLVRFVSNKDAALLPGAFWRQREYDDAG
jgi:hypothetical protein